jgi:hypothetical protein
MCTFRHPEQKSPNVNVSFEGFAKDPPPPLQTYQGGSGLEISIPTLIDPAPHQYIYCRPIVRLVPECRVLFVASIVVATVWLQW